ncbi:hypothetical protein [Cytobacillus purgationiresistens]|uniref:Penicillin-binding protein n=1 Tax=Cytobacillus purgationiresistens TaxID=863449 RepID=A0ABU0AHZ4_9BACI|nr:hypothetical protein [Cytobacillus purgationiresistens]MDQ0270879.1 hypothetical protein [Cytobacillus purgationiresistens]
MQYYYRHPQPGGERFFPFAAPFVGGLLGGLAGSALFYPLIARPYGPPPRPYGPYPYGPGPGQYGPGPYGPYGY